MRMVFATVSAPAARCLPGAAKRLNALSPGVVSVKVYYCASGLPDERLSDMARDISEADAAFLDLMGASPEVCAAVEEGCKACRGQIIPYGATSRQYMRLGSFTAGTGKTAKKPDAAAMKRMSAVADKMAKFLPGPVRDMANYGKLVRYFRNANDYNCLQLLLLLAGQYGHAVGLPKPGRPQTPEGAALYDLDSPGFFNTASGYDKKVKTDGKKPPVVLFFGSGAYPTDNTPCLKAVKDALSDICRVYPIGVSGDYAVYEKNLKSLLSEIRPELIINVKPFRFSAGPMGGEAGAGVELLNELGAPMLHPFILTRRTESQWRESAAGVTPGELLISVLLPELDGSADTFPIGAMCETENDGETGAEIHELCPIEERLSRLRGRVEKYLSLRYKPNREKRVAILCYNYPPGESNIFGGAFLDTFESVSAILRRLKLEGYDTEEMTADDLRAVFCAGRAVNNGKYETNWDGRILFPAKMYVSDPEQEPYWGKSPGDIMTENGAFFIPGCVAGSVFIGLQPDRSSRTSDGRTYHDKSRPPHHQYAAFYQWLREEFKADAVIHVGTHGTLEFLPGKECGVSGDCWPDRLIGDMPHIYLYYCGNPAESVLPKRRAHAVIVSYQPPVFAESGLYGPMLELNTALENYRQISALSPAGAPDALKEVMEKCAALGLSGDVSELEAETERMAHSLIPVGLHVFGKPYTPGEADKYARGLARLRAGGEPDEKALKQALEDTAGARANREMDALTDALCARYIPPRLAGDIYRNPEVLPSGYNLYQFDPRLIPGESAMRRGKEICENTIRAYSEEHGRLPRSTAIVLWGLETSRTQGETVGQLLAYLGVRISPDSHVWQRKFEIVPVSELGRPRIDVTVNICGFFRDMFGGLLEELGDLFEKLSELPETDEENYLKANSRRRYEKLLDEGFAPDQARRLAESRIFGPREAEYGTGLTKAVENADWREEKELAEIFTGNLCHVYNRRMRGAEAPGLYEDNLRCVELISQLRSSHEYEITDLDHYYEFFGGLSKSVELAKGERAAMYITDVTSGKALTETAEKAIARGLRTRTLNPKWINGMLEHKYHGAQKIADRFENVLGLAATTGAVDPRFYDDLEAVYVADETMRRRMAENNPHAYMDILERMLEYNARGYWQATREQFDRIKKTYLELEDCIEDAL